LKVIVTKEYKYTNINVQMYKKKGNVTRKRYKRQLLNYLLHTRQT